MFSFKKILNKAWDLLEHLDWDNFEFEKARKTLRYPTSDPYVFHAKSYSYDQYRDPYAQPCYSVPDYVSMWCDSCHASDHNANNCPYYMPNHYNKLLLVPRFMP